MPFAVSELPSRLTSAPSVTVTPLCGERISAFGAFGVSVNGFESAVALLNPSLARSRSRACVPAGTKFGVIRKSSLWRVYSIMPCCGKRVFAT